MAPPRPRRSARLVACAIFAFIAVLPVAGQTRITPPKNKFTPEQDVKLGLEAAAEARQQLPVIHDREVSGYLTGVGERLVAAAPPELNHPAYEYSFTCVNLREINAFALPGGPMFVNRGMIDAAGLEGEMAGVMAHELAHVLLRHGTANITKAQSPGIQLGALAGAIAGAIIGGTAGAVVADGTQFGLGTLMLKYGRDYERQADLLGAQIMARAGYDPRDLARMFERIQQQGGGGGPEWLSSHPNPGNRTEYIEQEAAQLRIVNPIRETPEFDRVRAGFQDMGPPMTAEQAARRARTGRRAPAVGTLGGPVPPPSTQYRAVRGGQLLEASVPANWRPLSTNSSIRFVPDNAFGEVDGRYVFTHGVEMGVARTGTRDLDAATEQFIGGLASSNDLRQAGEVRATQLAQRSALATPLVNRSDVTGRDERVTVYTALMADGNLFYYATVVPEDDAGHYQDAFARVRQSIRLRDR